MLRGLGEPQSRVDDQPVGGDTRGHCGVDRGQQFGPNLGDLLTNGLSVDATGVSGQYTKNLAAPLVGDINRPAEAVTNRWYWNLTAN